MSGEQLMALLGLPLKHRLPRQGWREVLSCIHCNAPIKTLGNGKKINSLCSSCSEVFVQAQGSWNWVPFQGSSVFRYWSPPVLQAASCFCGSSDITDTAQRPPQWLQLLFSVHGLHPMVTMAYMETSPVCQHPSFAFCSLSSSCMRRQPKTSTRSGFILQNTISNKSWNSIFLCRLPYSLECLG